MPFVGEKKIGEELIPSYVCPECGQRTVYLVPYDIRYEVAWIPMFRATKITKLDCTSCVYNQEVVLRDPSLKKMEKEIRRAKGFNYLNFIGIPIIALLMTGVVLYFNSRPVTKPEFPYRVLKPKHGQQYAVYVDSAKYVIWKVVEFKEDSLWMVESKEGSPVKMGLAAIRGHGFLKDTFAITILELDQWLHPARTKEIEF